MAIDQTLLQRLQDKLGIGRSRVYELIKERSERLLISRELAAIALAHESGINVSRFASAQDLGEIRHASAAAAGTAFAPCPAALLELGVAVEEHQSCLQVRWFKEFLVRKRRQAQAGSGQACVRGARS